MAALHRRVRVGRVPEVRGQILPAAVGEDADDDGALVELGGEDIRTRDGFDTPVAESDTVILLPAMAGG